jgi:hypothetical protein
MIDMKGGREEEKRRKKEEGRTRLTFSYCGDRSFSAASVTQVWSPPNDEVHEQSTERMWALYEEVDDGRKKVEMKVDRRRDREKVRRDNARRT